MAASFNTSLERAKGDVIGKELRAIALGNLNDYSGRYGLMCFSPMINIIRDPFCKCRCYRPTLCRATVVSCVLHLTACQCRAGQH